MPLYAKVFAIILNAAVIVATVILTPQVFAAAGLR